MQIAVSPLAAAVQAAPAAVEIEALLRQENAELKADNAALKQQVQRLMHELLMFKRRLFGRASEASDQLQVQDDLFGDPIVEIDLPPAGTPPLVKPTSEPKQRHPRTGRAVLPPGLKRVEEVLLPADVQADDGTLKPGFVQIGEERTERLACTPGEFWVDVIVRPKFARREASSKEGVEDTGSTIRIAALPRFVVDSGLFHETLLAQVVLAKVDDHIPLHRQSEMLLRDCGVRLPVSTLSDQVLHVGHALTPLWKALFDALRRGDAMHVDETTLPTQAKGGARKTRAWTFASTGGPRHDARPDAPITDPPIICYLYSDDKSGVHVRKQLSGWQGYLQADASNVYDQLFGKSPGIREVVCWAHARRKFFDIAKASEGRITAHEAVERINALFAIERQASEQQLLPSERHQLRQKHAVPLIQTFRAWAIEQVGQLSPKSPTAKAFAYLDNHWDAFVRYTERGDLKIDNNAAERALRVVALGRKNWLFAGSERGGQAIAVLLSLIETAKANGLNPRTWLVDTLTKLPRWPNNRLDELLPLRKSA